MSHSHSAEELQKHVKVYLTVFGSLMVLTVVTVAVSYLHLSLWPALILALVIASVKAGMVASYFMHLIGEKKLILGILAITFLILFCMFAIFISAYHDQVGRAAVDMAGMVSGLA
ncbi:MAG: cytochrome c oxidase subunit 4 [Rhodothermales bacterium]|jgi:cytochrome c oxidase subunit 4